jgi:hypothetical protein
MLTLSEWQAKMAAASFQPFSGRPDPCAPSGFRLSDPGGSETLLMGGESLTAAPEIDLETELFEG